MELGRMGNVEMRFREDDLFSICRVPDATCQDSFQRRLELIFKEFGIGYLRKPEQVMDFLEDSYIEQKTKNVFRIILMTKAVEWLISYAEGKRGRESVEKDCASLLQDEWGLSSEVCIPVIEQVMNAIDHAVEERTNAVGKSICKQLKDMRRRFAEANQIEYYEEDCTETRPCAGTCPYCEERTKYLVEEARKIAAVRDVVYPQIAEDEIGEDMFPTDDFRYTVGEGQVDEKDVNRWV